MRLLTARGRAVADTSVAPDGRHFWRGFLTNILNPKVGIFYVSFLPQFIPPGANIPSMILLMTLIHAGLGFLWFALLISVTRPVAGALKQPGFRVWLDRVTGGVFIALGARLAFEQSS